MTQLKTTELIQLIGANLKKVPFREKTFVRITGNLSDIDLSTISRIDRGIVNTSIFVIFALAKALI